LHCRREKEIACVSCSATATQSAIVAEISNHLIFGNDCRKLGGVVKEGQGRSRLMNDTFLDQPMKSVMKTYIAGVATLCDGNAMLLSPIA
jgi:hypothetical protein